MIILVLLRPHPSLVPPLPSFLYQLFFSILPRHGKVGALASLKGAGFPRWLLRWKFFFSQILLPILLCDEMIWKEKEERYRGDVTQRIPLSCRTNWTMTLIPRKRRGNAFVVWCRVEDKREKKKKEIYYRRSNIRCPSRYPRDAWPIFLVRHIQRAFFHSPFSYKRETRVEKKIIYRNGSTLMYNAFLLTNEVFCRWRRRRKVWKQLRSSLKRNSRKD